MTPETRTKPQAQKWGLRILIESHSQPYARERFEDTYRWTMKWNMTVPGATYENTVDTARGSSAGQRLSSPL